MYIICLLCIIAYIRCCRGGCRPPLQRGSSGCPYVHCCPHCHATPGEQRERAAGRRRPAAHSEYGARQLSLEQALRPASGSRHAGGPVLRAATPIRSSKREPAPAAPGEGLSAETERPGSRRRGGGGGSCGAVVSARPRPARRRRWHETARTTGTRRLGRNDSGNTNQTWRLKSMSLSNDSDAMTT